MTYCRLVLTLLVAGFLGAQIAFAGGSPPTDASFSVDLPADFFAPGACAFPIRVSVTGNAASIVLPGNRLIVTAPGQDAVITNLSDGSNVTLNITGVFHVSTDQNGDTVTVVTGRNLLGDPVAGFVLAIGDFSFIFDSAGNLIQPLTGTGTLTDVCTLIP